MTPFTFNDSDNSGPFRQTLKQQLKMSQNNKIGSYGKITQYGHLNENKTILRQMLRKIQGDARRVYVRHLRLRKPQSNNWRNKSCKNASQAILSSITFSIFLLFKMRKIESNFSKSFYWIDWSTDKIQL